MTESLSCAEESELSGAKRSMYSMSSEDIFLSSLDDRLDSFSTKLAIIFENAVVFIDFRS